VTDAIGITESTAEYYRLANESDESREVYQRVIHELVAR
jgi:hypothetical protein